MWPFSEINELKQENYELRMKVKLLGEALIKATGTKKSKELKQ